jgi:hypothetical protein
LALVAKARRGGPCHLTRASTAWWLVAAAVLGAAQAAPSRAPARPTVWLCRPGLPRDPCTPGLSTTVYSPSLRPLARIEARVRRLPVDCFYAYPTVSDQPTGNADLQVGPEERSVALYQAAFYSQDCRVFAPVYRQVTLRAGVGRSSTPPSRRLAFTSLESAFFDYLRHYNHGRGFVLIGHSQGAFVLRQLIRKDLDPVPSLRRHLVSAILLGGNVLVRPGPAGLGGDFRHVPACRFDSQVGCVVAFSSFDQPVPADSLFGRPVSSATGGPPPPGQVVLCTNPASLSGGSGLLDPVLPTAPFARGTTIAAGSALVGLRPPNPAPPTVWWSVPGAYLARCSAAGGARVLQVSPVDGAPRLAPSPDARWGLHLLDANLALGNLVRLVAHQAAAYLHQRH